MKYRKVLFILALPFLLEALVACCDCLETTFFDYSNCAITVENLDNAGVEPVITNAASVARAAYGLRVRVERREPLCHQPWQPKILPTAYAFSCDCPPEEAFSARDSIVAIHVIARTALTPGGADDEDVTDRFRIFNGQFVTVADFIPTWPKQLFSLEFDPAHFDLLLLDPPVAPSTNQFTVVIDLSDGRRLSSTATPIELR
ncbi:MAG: DUF5034 domain-containing protein [Bacteroidota bacterium]